MYSLKKALHLYSSKKRCIFCEVAQRPAAGRMFETSACFRNGSETGALSRIDSLFTSKDAVVKELFRMTFSAMVSSDFVQRRRRGYGTDVRSILINDGVTRNDRHLRRDAMLITDSPRRLSLRCTTK